MLFSRMILSYCIFHSGCVVGHMGVNTAPQSGPGSCSLRSLCSAYSYIQNSDVRISSIYLFHTAEFGLSNRHTANLMSVFLFHS